MKRFDYHLLEKLGEGGYGSVWSAIDSAGRRCALKFLLDVSPTFVESLRDEVSKLVRLHGTPGIVKILDYDLESPRPYVALELADGSLADLVQGPLDQTAAVRFGVQVARVVRAAHQRGVVHRDIKPENILLRDGSIRLADFGLGKGFESMLLTMGGAGTPGYMAPEQKIGAAGTEADVYGLGATLFHMLTGLRPRDDRDSLDPRRHGAKCNGRLAELVADMTSADPAERPTTDEVIAVLTEVLKAVRPSRQVASRSPAGAAAGGVLAALAVVGGAWALTTMNRYDRNVGRYRASDGTFRPSRWG